MLHSSVSLCMDETRGSGLGTKCRHSVFPASSGEELTRVQDSGACGLTLALENRPVEVLGQFSTCQRNVVATNTTFPVEPASAMNSRKF